jgi:hypothetical protein
VNGAGEIQVHTCSLLMTVNEQVIPYAETA